MIASSAGLVSVTSTNLTEHFDHFINDCITSGRFSNASEMVREGLRLLEQREREDRAKIEWLRGAAKKRVRRHRPGRLRAPEFRGRVGRLLRSDSPGGFSRTRRRTETRCRLVASDGCNHSSL